MGDGNMGDGNVILAERTVPDVLQELRELDAKRDGLREKLEKDREDLLSWLKEIDQALEKFKTKRAQKVSPSPPLEVSDSRQAVVAFVKKKPGRTSKEIAQAVGFSTHFVSSLAREGLIQGVGNTTARRYFPLEEGK